MREAKQWGGQQDESSSVTPEAAELSTTETMDQDVLLSENSSRTWLAKSARVVWWLDGDPAIRSMSDARCDFDGEFQGMNVKDAAQEAGLIVGFNEKTVRKHRNDFFNNKGYLTESIKAEEIR